MEEEEENKEEEKATITSLIFISTESSVQPGRVDSQTCFFPEEMVARKEDDR